MGASRKKVKPTGPLSISALRKLARRWEKKADKALSVYSRAKTLKEYGGCVFCGGPVEHCFHFISRRRRLLRWVLGNTIGSCRKCNKFERYFPDKFRVWFIERYGLNRYLSYVSVASLNLPGWRPVDDLDREQLEKLIGYLTAVADYYKDKYTELVRKD